MFFSAIIANVAMIGSAFSCFLGCLGFLDEEHRCCAKQQEDTGKHQHIHLWSCSAFGRECLQYGSAKHGCNYLRQAYRAVEQSKIGSHLGVALKCIGKKRKWHRQHSCPSSSYQQEAHPQHKLVGDPVNRDKAHAANEKAHHIGKLVALELRYQSCPDD